MKALKTFVIPFTGLKIGKHQFDFDVDNQFFDEFEFSLIKTGSLKVMVDLDKQETMLILNFHIKGCADLTCDRCLASFSADMEIRERQLVKFVEDDLESDDVEIMMLKRSEHEINIAELIYEYITVSVPYYKVCNELSAGTCDAEMLKHLSALNDTTEEEEHNDKGDPRWEALKKLKG